MKVCDSSLVGGAVVGYTQNSMVKFPDPNAVAVFVLLVETIYPLPDMNTEPIEL
jgi:hypothetical protein